MAKTKILNGRQVIGNLIDGSKISPDSLKRIRTLR